MSASEKAWFEYTNYKQSAIQFLFTGQLRNTLKCKECGAESASYEAFTQLILELPESSRPCNIEDCMKMFFHGEAIDDWNCPKCKQKRVAIKKLDIAKMPPILVIQLKR